MRDADVNKHLVQEDRNVRREKEGGRGGEEEVGLEVD